MDRRAVNVRVTTDTNKSLLIPDKGEQQFAEFEIISHKFISAKIICRQRRFKGKIRKSKPEVF